MLILWLLYWLMCYGMKLTCTQKTGKISGYTVHYTPVVSVSTASDWRSASYFTYSLLPQQSQASPASYISSALTRTGDRCYQKWLVCLLFTCVFPSPPAPLNAVFHHCGLRRLKTFLRSTMSQERLNHVAVLHVHKDLTDNINLHELCNDFISRNDVSKNISNVLNSD